MTVEVSIEDMEEFEGIGEIEENTVLVEVDMVEETSPQDESSSIQESTM